MDGQTLYDAINRPVVLKADQTPQYSEIRRAGHGGGDFLFVRTRYEFVAPLGIGNPLKPLEKALPCDSLILGF